MKQLCLIAVLLLFGWTSAQAAEPASYRISLTNLTSGQVMTPPLWVVHQSSFSLFTLGEPASPGLQTLAKDGDPGTLIGEIETRPDVNGYAVGDGVAPVELPTDAVFPGGVREVTVAGSPTGFLSVASMLATTNDAFVSYRGLSLNMPPGESQVVFLYVYDAGAEDNDEDCAHIPGPPCGNGGEDTLENEGFIHFHPGLHLRDDLGSDLQPSHSFASIAAKIVIERIK